jgi:hypothetical protein
MGAWAKLVWSTLVFALVTPAWVDPDDQWVASRRNWWAFQPVKRHAPPAIRDPWIRTPIDAFLLEALQSKRIAPSRPLEKEALVRRLFLDLTGVPPAPGEVDLFLRDASAVAYGKLVDRLMASPHYGERWAVRWLDIVRYADTNGFELDADRPHAWRYRDYVVSAFNQDKPYDRFLTEQIAGDELYPGDQDALIATGFHRAGPEHLVGGNQDEEMNRQETLTEMTGAIGSTFLGLSIGCARCHNHKFDPIPQSDYYRLQAVFAGTVGANVVLAASEQKKAHEETVKAFEARIDPIKKEIQGIEKPYRERLREQKRAKLDSSFRAALEVPPDQRNEEQKRLAREAEAQIGVSWDDVVFALAPEDKARRAGLRAQIHRLEYERPEPLRTAYAVTNSHIAPLTYVLKVGSHKMKQDVVNPGLLRVLNGGEVVRTGAGRRSALAQWLSSPEHPLTARVMANRIWQLRMGTGLVATPNDFGVLGQRPTNAKLLDWLAAEFVHGGWSVKRLDRLILMSNAYRQQIAHDAAKAKADPDNKLYWRQNRRRLEAEFLRDSVLAVAGTLNPRLGGRPVRAPIEPEVYDLIFTEAEPDNLWPVDLNPAEHRRRSLYLLNKRTVRLPFMANFDQPDGMTSCPQRPTSTHALQALSLMNSDLMADQSRAFAARIAVGCATDDCRVRRAYKLALARAPKAIEVSMARDFLANRGRWQDFCLALLNRSEFAYVP